MILYQHRTQAFFFNILKSIHKKGISYDILSKNNESILKEITKKPYYNLIFKAYFKPQAWRKIKKIKKSLK